MIPPLFIILDSDYCLVIFVLTLIFHHSLGTAQLPIGAYLRTKHKQDKYQSVRDDKIRH